MRTSIIIFVGAAFISFVNAFSIFTGAQNERTFRSQNAKFNVNNAASVIQINHSHPNSSALLVRGGADIEAKGEPSLPLRLWHQYLQQLEARPLITKGWTSVVVGSVGDILGQYMTARAVRVPFIWDSRRTAVYATVSIMIGSTAVHYWFEFLDKVVANPKKVKGLYNRVFRQLLVDQTVGCTLINAGFYVVHTIVNAAFLGTLFPFHSVLSSIKVKLSSEMWPMLLNNWKLWPAANFINFTLIPPQLRVLFANFVSIFWSAYLSNSANRIKPA